MQNNRNRKVCNREINGRTIIERNTRLCDRRGGEKCSLSELLTKKPQKNEIKKDTPGYGGKPRKYWGYGGFIKRKISCL